MMLHKTFTLVAFAALCAAFPLSAHATACPGGVSCSVDSTAAGPNLTIGSGGKLAITVDKTTGQATVSQQLQLQNGVSSPAGTDLTIGAAGNVALTVDKTAGQVSASKPMILGQDTSTSDCSATVNYGAVRFNPSTTNFEGCNGHEWSLMGTSGVTTYFSDASFCNGCGFGSNSSEGSWTIYFSSHGITPPDANYQIICTLYTDGNGASLNIRDKTASSFVITVNNSYTNYDNNPHMSIDCMYHHS